MSDLIKNEKEDLGIDVLGETLEIVINDTPYIGTLPKIAKIFYLKSLEKKWKLFLKYAISGKEFLDKLEQDPRLLSYLTDYFEVVRRTQSTLAIKTLALIFRDFKNDKRMKQKACRAFAEISDETLEYFLKFTSDEFVEKRKDLKSKKWSFLTTIFFKKEPSQSEFVALQELIQRNLLVNEPVQVQNTHISFCSTNETEKFREYILKAKTIKEKMTPTTKISINKKNKKNLRH